MNCDDGSLFTLLMRVASNHVWCLMSWEVSNYHHKEIIKLMFQELTFCPNDWWRAKYSKCHLCYLLYWEYFLHLEVFFRRAFRILQIKLNPEIHVIRCMLNSLINVTKCPVKSKCKPPFKNWCYRLYQLGLGLLCLPLMRTLYDIHCLYFSPEVMANLKRRARGHFVKLNM